LFGFEAHTYFVQIQPHSTSILPLGYYVLIEELRLIVIKKTASFRKERALIHLSHALVARV